MNEQADLLRDIKRKQDGVEEHQKGSKRQRGDDDQIDSTKQNKWDVSSVSAEVKRPRRSRWDLTPDDDSVSVSMKTSRFSDAVTAGG